ncbi:MAG: CsgG/HfaB family protein [Elusimicrobiota bacterium]|jgi:TolB-like protein|nr:CsgG/HfaB family protein [Elusimicrobiota bacterium]
MKSYNKIFAAAVFLFLSSFLFADIGFDSAFDSLIPYVKNSVKDKKIVVAGFKNSDNGAHDSFSVLLEDEISNVLIKSMPSQVIVKSRLDIILGEISLSADNVFDNASRKQIGKLSSADFILSGNYRINNGDIIVNIQAVDIESGTGLMSKQIIINREYVPQYILQSEPVKTEVKKEVKEPIKERQPLIEITAEAVKSPDSASKISFIDGFVKGFSGISKSVIGVLDSIASAVFKAFLDR